MHMYLALLQRINGDYEAALEVLRPYIQCSFDVLECARYSGQLRLSTICIASGQEEDAAALVAPYRKSWARKCEGCRD
jgi:hypothetical protein